MQKESNTDVKCIEDLLNLKYEKIFYLHIPVDEDTFL
jgi:hypothetical protein